MGQRQDDEKDCSLRYTCNYIIVHDLQANIIDSYHRLTGGHHL